jgi:YaaC-like Protein
MAFRDIEVGGKPLTVHEAMVSPKFGEKTVLVNDTWDYIELWLKRNHRKSSARLFWDQSRYFFQATKVLPKESSPLTAYYSMLNASKALLLVKRKRPTNPPQWREASQRPGRPSVPTLLCLSSLSPSPRCIAVSACCPHRTIAFRQPCSMCYVSVTLLHDTVWYLHDKVR